MRPGRMNACIRILMIWAALLIAGGAHVARASVIGPADVRSAERAYETEAWEAARKEYAFLAANAPWNGSYWRRLAEACAALGDAPAAERAYLRMRETGFETGPAAFEIAAIKVAREDYRGAAEWLKTALSEGMNNVAFRLLVDPRFAPAFEDEAFAAVFRPTLPDGATRAEQWRTDLDHLDRHYRLTHVDPFGRTGEAQWNAALAALKAEADAATDARMAVGLMRLMALAGDGHSMPFAPYGDDLFGVATTPAFFTVAPVEFYDFGGEIRVIAAAEEHADLVGARVERIGDVSVEEAYARLRDAMPADNDYQKRWMAMRYLATPEVLHALGVSRAPSRCRIVARRDDGARLRKTLVGAPHTEERFTRAVPSLDRKQIPDTPEDRPLYLKRAEEPFFLHWDEAGILYVQINTLLNDGERTVEAFGRDLADAIDAHQPRAVVVDLRWNSGGDSGFNKYIVNALAGSAADAPGKLFTIIGRKTFSAAINLTSALKTYTHTRLVGEPSGAGPNFIGETNAVFLPNTGMIVSVSNRRHQGVLSERRDRWWTPDLPAEPNWRDYENGVDPAMRAIERYLDMTR